MSLWKSLKAEAGKLVEEVSKAFEKKGPEGATKGNPGTYPWGSGNSSFDNAFFPGIKIDAERADKIYPYKLIVIDVTKSNQIVGPNGSGAGQNQDFFVRQDADTGGLQFTYQNFKKWEFTLPITPKQLNITDQFAISTSATMRGIIEEHNGVKFKMIQASGTTGVWPVRKGFDDPTPNERGGSFGGLFGGTIEALGNLADAGRQFSNLANAASGNPPPPPESYYKDTSDGKNTGYYQALMLQQFLEQYAMAKKNPKYKGWRLVFHCPKTNESFIVTPMQYTLTRSERAPQEFLYNMQFKAWKRIDLKSPSKADPARKQLINAADPTFLTQLVNTLDAARSVMSASLNVIKAVRADFRRPFDILRKTSLLAKDVGGIIITAGDLPNQINRDIQSATKFAFKNLFLASGGVPPGGSSVNPSSQSQLSSISKQIKDEDDKNEGVNTSSVEEGGLGRGSRDAQRVSPLNNVFNEPEGNFDFFNQISVDSLDLTPQQRFAIEDERDRNNLLSVEEIKGFITEIESLAEDIANNFGAGDAFYSEITGKPAPRERAVPMTIEEFQILSKLEDAINQMRVLTSTRELDDIRIQSPLEYVGGLAEDSGIDFNIDASSKYLAPVPFGLTIQEISARYLGDIDRYNEIITLNNLRSPYIDEDGFSYDLLSNGDGRQFNISTNQNLFIGQKVQLSSNTVPMFTRKITGIEKISDVNYLITVDGLSNLDQLRASENASLKAFLPGTVNSQNQIYIPSDLPADPEPRTFDIPFLEEDDLTGLSKVDWLLDESGDVVLNSFGEVALANGLNNIVQAVKTKIRTGKGQLLEDSSYGLGLTPGVNITDVAIQELAKDLRDMILQDSRFEDVDKIEIVVLPPTVSITIKAVLANGRGLFPINFDVSA